MVTAAPPAAIPVARPPIILPSRGVARVKSVLSGDTVILLGKASTPNGKAPEVIFTLENISAPRYVLITVRFFFSFGYCGKAQDKLNNRSVMDRQKSVYIPPFFLDVYFSPLTHYSPVQNNDCESINNTIA